MRLYAVIQGIIGFCVFAIFTSILLDFLLFSKTQGVKREKKSIVETGTMTMFFLVFYFILVSKEGVIQVQNNNLKDSLIVVGTFIIVAGCIFNIMGRVSLGDNWANHIKIYEKHELIEKGMYKYIRHPLYSSIIFMFYGASLVYSNTISFIAVTFIFIPFMYYRAKQEEKLLLETFPEYTKYKRRVGMFLPKLIWKD